MSYREFLNGDKSRLKVCVFDMAALLRGGSFEICEIDRDRSETPDSGYSAWIQLDDGEIVMVNYIVDGAPRAYIRGYRIRRENG